MTALRANRALVADEILLDGVEAPDESSRIWLCTEDRVFPLPEKEAAA